MSQIDFRYKSCRQQYPHAILGDGYARLMGLDRQFQHNQPRNWTPEDDEFIRVNYPSHSQTYLEKHFGCCFEALLKRLIFLGLRKSKRRYIRWREYHTKKLQALYGKIPSAEIARQMGFGIDYVQDRARRLGLSSDLWRKSAVKKKKTVAPRSNCDCQLETYVL